CVRAEPGFRDPSPRAFTSVEEPSTSSGKAMDYMAYLRNGGQPAGNYNMQPYQNNATHQGYSYPYTHEQLNMMAQMKQRAMMHHHGNMPPSKQNEPKPRLSKDEVELLEREFLKNPKPTSGRKREIAELLKVDHPRINVSSVLACLTVARD